MKGWVYVISNPSMPGLLKIGYSLKDPSIRARELEGTGMPTPYRVEYAALVDDPHRIEQSLHDRFAHFRKRKEWFAMTLDTLVPTVREVLKDRYVELGESLYRFSNNVNRNDKIVKSQFESRCLACGARFPNGNVHDCDSYRRMQAKGHAHPLDKSFDSWKRSYGKKTLQCRFCGQSYVASESSHICPESTWPHTLCYRCKTTIKFPPGKRLAVTCQKCGSSMTVEATMI